jgi:hypothetical protein
MEQSRALKISHYKTKWEKVNQFERVYNVQQGELSGLSVTRERLLVGTGLFSSTHRLLLFATAVGCPEIK